MLHCAPLPERDRQFMKWKARSTSNSAGRLVFVGFGSVGQGSLPLLLRHIDMPHERISIVTGDERGRAEAAHYGIKFEVTPLTRENYRAVLEPLIGRGDFLLNLSVDVSSVALIELCYEKGAMYLDTCIEPWLGGYTDQSVSPSHRSNYGLREAVLRLRGEASRRARRSSRRTARIPGLISHWVKQAMVNIARDIEGERRRARARATNGRSSRCELGVKVDPLRRARHAGRRSAQAPLRVREHVVGRRLHRRRLAAVRARLGLAREALPARRQAARVRLQGGDLSHAARRVGEGALVDAERRPVSTVS